MCKYGIGLKINVLQKGKTSRAIISTLVFTTLLIGCSHAIKTDKDKTYAGHPIIGVWNFEINGCFETYEFLPDGTRNVTSNQELVKAAYTVSDKMSERGFYKLTDEVLENNGKADCLGSTNDMTGDIVELYIAFNPRMDQFIFCAQESFDKCFGPFQKR